MNIVKDVHQSLIGRAELERTRSIATAQEESSRGTHESVQQLIVLQNKLEYVEVFLIAVYSAHLLEILGTGFEIEHRWTGVFSLAFSIMAALVALFALRPWRTARSIDRAKVVDLLSESPSSFWFYCSWLGSFCS